MFNVKFTVHQHPVEALMMKFLLSCDSGSALWNQVDINKTTNEFLCLCKHYKHEG